MTLSMQSSAEQDEGVESKVERGPFRLGWKWWEMGQQLQRFVL